MPEKGADAAVSGDRIESSGGGFAMAGRRESFHHGLMSDELMSDAIVPDEKDWTWVLDRPCPECGFDAGAFRVTEVGAMIRRNGADFVAVLSRPADEVRRRPDPATWSPLEYGAHVRDVYRRYLERLTMMLLDDDPLYPNWDQDATAVEDDYLTQDPAEVAVALSSAAEELAAAFDQVVGAQWERPGRRSDGASFSVETFARYLIHDPIHHLHDVDT